MLPTTITEAIKFLSGGGLFAEIKDLIVHFIPTKADKEKALQEAKLADWAHSLELQKLQIHLYELIDEDVKSAREMNQHANDSPQASWLAKNMVHLLALFSILFAVIIEILIMTKAVVLDRDDRAWVHMFAALLAGGPLQFYFGGSIRDSLNKLVTPAQPVSPTAPTTPLSPIR